MSMAADTLGYWDIYALRICLELSFRFGNAGADVLPRPHPQWGSPPGPPHPLPRTKWGAAPYADKEPTMRLGNTTRFSIFASTLLFAACSGGSSPSGTTAGTISSVLQDLGVDPSGLTTVVSLPHTPGALSPANFEANGGQLALSVSVAGNAATVTWDARVTPSHQVRAVSIPSVGTAYVGVSSSDGTAPTFTITGGTQAAGVGNDTLDLNFSGAQLIEAEAENLANWRLLENGSDVDLTGSVFDYDPVTSKVAVALGASAGLHASFEVFATGVHSVSDADVDAGSVNGAAIGDVSVPTLVSSDQHLGSDEYGRVVDFVFSEALDPNFTSSFSSFTTTLPVFSYGITQIAEDTLRVTFTEPMIPTVDSVTVKNLWDFHGNAFATVVAPIGQGSSVANDFSSSPEVRTVENSENDQAVILFDQAIDPIDANDPAHWDLVVDGNPVDLSGQLFSYDFLAKSLTITLDSDFVNGTAFTFKAATGNEPLDIDGDLFVTSYTGTVDGDVSLPEVVASVQNRNLDGNGATVDVMFGEDVAQTAAEVTGNWSVTGGLNVLSATRMADLRTVRLELDAAIIPGDQTISADLVEDVAGNPMEAVTGLVVTSTDQLRPTISAPVAIGVEGALNDTVTVLFSDDMIESEVEQASSWFVQSPLSVPMDTTGATVDYDVSSREAVLTFTSGGDLPARHGFNVTMTGMRDIGGNTVTTTLITGVVDAETNYPVVEIAWVDAVDDSLVHLRMNEPSTGFSDYYDPILNPTAFTVYELYDGLGTFVGYPVSAVVSGDMLQVDVDFGLTVTAGLHTLDVRGITDLATNQIFPVKNLPIFAEDSSAPMLQFGISAGLSVSGEFNDILTVVFDRAMSPWGMEDISNYTVELLGAAIDLSRATISFDGVQTTTINLDQLGAVDLLTSSTYDVIVSGVFSAYGVEVVGSTTDSFVAAGDSSVPTLDASKVRMDANDPTNSLLIEMSEAIRADDGSDETLVDIGAVNPDLALRVGRRTTRVTFNGGASIGATVNVSFRDLAGNLGIASQLAVGQDVAGPTVTSVTGVIQEGEGGDLVLVRFDKPVQTGLGLDVTHYTIDQGGVPFTLNGLQARYVSGTNTVVFPLGDGQNLNASQSVHVTASGVTDLSGLVMTAADITGSVSGDATTPSLVEAFVNYREDFTGRSIDVRVSEDVSPLLLSLPVAWTSTGGQSVMTVSVLQGDVYRVTFLSTLSPGDQLQVMAGVEDLAGNAAGALTVDVTL